MSVQPFRVEVSSDALQDLRRRLRETRWPDSVSGSGWTYGTDLAYLRGLVEYWAARYDWPEHERAINAFPHFRAQVDGVGLHFIHARGVGQDPLPIILTHGWPGSFLEFLPILPMLTDPASHGGSPEDAFDVVVPSLPGYGFSDRPTAPGMHNRRIAELWARLMSILGYERFGSQGGDWGAGVSTWLALDHPERLAGIHLNYIPGSYQPHVAPDAPLTQAERTFLAERERWVEEEGAYGHLQMTRPQTLAVGLNDSPAGLAAWIIEKFRDWGDCDGDVESRFDRDWLLTNVTLYWVTETFHSSARLYYESCRTPLRLEPGRRVPVPCGVAVFPKEEPMPPREWVERAYEVVRWTPMPRGGHFAALEEPDLLAEDIRAFFRPYRRAR